MDTNEHVEAAPAVVSTVQKWTEKIRSAKKHFEKDFERMRNNMEFVAGLQRLSQEGIETEAYTANLTLRTLAQKKSVLYAKNPTAEAVRRERLDFQLWDGKMETLMAAYQSAAMNPMDLHSMALLNDYMVGTQKRQIVERVGDSLRLTYEWNVDNQEPDFKSQMKDLVDRVLVCGVGYVKLSFVRDSLTVLSDGDKSTTADRAQRAKALLEKLEKGELDKDDASFEDLRLLLGGLTTPASEEDPGDVKEKLVFQFLGATSVIIDPQCRSLRGFTGARWIAQEYMLPVQEVNEYFECDVRTSQTKYYGSDGIEQTTAESKADNCDQMVCVWEVFDKRTLTSFFICEGYNDYLQAPEMVQPTIKHVWPILPLTFNRVETVPGLRVTVYPPSDVDLIKHAQKEWNRTREALRDHRKANAPKYITSADLSREDVERIECAEPHAVVKLTSVPTGTDVTKLFVPVAHAPLNPTLYDTAPLLQDILQAAGMQEANLGPVTGNETATGQTIAEQSRMSAAASNVDDLDDFLSLLYRSGGEMLLREASEETVKLCAGPGAMWLEQYREQMLSDVYLQISAASSGRPNKAVDVATFERIAPFLIQAGANPQALIREGVRRLGDSLDIPSFFPLGGMLPAPASNEVQPQQSLQSLPSQASVPLVAS